MKRIIFIFIFVFFVFIIENLLHSIFGLWQKQQLLVNSRQEVEKAKQENQALKNQVLAVKQPSFIEEQARDKLLLGKKGEEIVVIPDKLIINKTESISQPIKENKTNWQLWWEAFF